MVYLVVETNVSAKDSDSGGRSAVGGTQRDLKRRQRES